MDKNIIKLDAIKKSINKYDICRLLRMAELNLIIQNFLRSIKSFFELNDQDFDLYKERILKSFFTYQFNDLPFNLYLFFPNSKDFLSTLMIAKNPQYEIKTDLKNFFLNLVEELTFLESFEKQIVDDTRDSNNTYIIWKNIYEREYEKLFTFMKSVENICYSVCKQNEIKFSHTSGRVKTFESFYNKIYSRANDTDENNALKAEHTITYVDAIDRPNTYYHKIFDFIRDLAGVRIVVLFEEDLHTILQLFRRLDQKGDLIVDDSHVRFYEQSVEGEDNGKIDSTKYNYRSLHMTVKPGKKRYDLIEYRNLIDVQCEIQFRSVLSHAWADVNHSLEYKNRDIIKEIYPDFQELLKANFSMLSKRLYENDKFLNDIKKDADKINLD